MAKKRKQLTETQKRNRDKRTILSILSTVGTLSVGASVGLPIWYSIKLKPQIVVINIAEISGDFQSQIKITNQTIDNGKLVINLQAQKSNEKIHSVNKVFMGNRILTEDEYDFNKLNQKLTINKEVLEERVENEKITIDNVVTVYSHNDFNIEGNAKIKSKTFNEDGSCTIVLQSKKSRKLVEEIDKVCIGDTLLEPGMSYYTWDKETQTLIITSEALENNDGTVSIKAVLEGEVEYNIELDQTSVELTTNGETTTAVINVINKKPTAEPVVWSVQQEGTVIGYTEQDDKIYIFAKSKGTATVTATLGTASASCSVSVKEIGLVLQDTASVLEQKTIDIEAKLSYSNAETINWSISPGGEDVIQMSQATPTESGSKVTITGLKAGKATIVASAGDISKICEISVVEDTVSVIDNNNNVYIDIKGLTSDTSDIKGKSLTPGVPDLNVKRSDFNYKIVFSEKVTSIGAAFLKNCTAFNQQIVLPNSLESIGGDFLRSCSSFNQQIVLPNSLQSIGGNFLTSCSSFNNGCDDGVVQNELVVPTSVATIPNYFLSGCKKFNQKISFNGATSIGEAFLSDCTIFNQEISLPESITEIKSNFLYYCKAFNNGQDSTSTKNFVIPSNVTKLDVFLDGCSAFNQKLILPSNLQEIGMFFLGYCTKFNQPLTLPSTIKSIGGYAFHHCENFNNGLAEGVSGGEFVIPTSITKIDDYFMNLCSAFNHEINIPSGVTSIGTHFMESCGKFNNTINLSKIDTASIILGSLFLNDMSNQKIVFKVANGTIETWRTKIKAAAGGGEWPSTWTFTEV